MNETGQPERMVIQALRDILGGDEALGGEK